jgi:heterogeneous nuclear ribonucleoprotein F/H
MRGLPFSATKENIVEFFNEFPPEEDSVVFSYRTDGRATGEAYAQFSSADESKAAMINLNRNMMGTRYIELFVSSKEEHRRMLNRAATR